jgi:DNA polymerase-1
MKEQTKTFLILDGNALLHRAWHAIPPLTTKNGLVVNAVYGFAMVIEKMREQFHPDFMAVAWDLPGKTFRHVKFAAYKATREKKEQELYDQIPLIQEMLRGFHIPSLSAEGYEADDVIGTLSNQRDGHKTLIVTGDLDALQLVDEKTSIVFFQKGISETKIYDVDAVKERYGLTPEQLIDFKALRGDASDNIPGVAGIGEKIATTLVQNYGSVDGIFEALKKGEIESKIAKKIEGKEEVAREARELVEIVRDVTLPFEMKDAVVKEPDWEKVLEQYQKFEFRTLLRKHADKSSLRADRLEGQTIANGFSRGTKSEKHIFVIRDVKELDPQFKSLATTVSIGILIADQQADLFGATMAALALSDGKTTVVVPNPAEKHLEAVRIAVGNRIAEGSSGQWAVGSGQKIVVTHDLKKLMHQLGSTSNFQFPISNFFDTMVASYLLHSGSRAHDLPSVISEQLGIKFPELPSAYATQKDYERLGVACALLPRLAIALRVNMEKINIQTVFYEIEMPLIPVLRQMEKIGIELDTDALTEFSKKLFERIQALEKSIHKISGNDFNVQSPIQLAEALFEKLKLPTKGIKKTKSGYSTAASELEKLWDVHEIIPLISEHRELAKLQSTYVEALPKLVGKDGRVHTTYNQTIAATGRLSSSEPNLQNIPIKTKLGREIRKAFVAPSGKCLLSADYSQIELRLAAVIAKDQPFIQAFKDGADIHTRTAAEVFDVEESLVTKEQRRAAKAINFGILYGMGPRSLSRSTNLSLADARAFIDRYFQIHHAIQTYLNETKIKAHQDGYVQTLFGRRRALPEIHSGVPMLVAQAERMAINMPIQGTAADIMKKAMLSVDGWLRQSRLPAVILLQVHDELVFEVEKISVDVVASGVKEMMESAASFEAPLIVDIEAGKNWGEMEAI